MTDRSTWIEPIDLFGLGRMWFDGRPGRECLMDQARFDAGDRSTVAIEIGSPIRGDDSRLEIEVAQDAGGRWWAGTMWRCWPVPDGTASGSYTPIDAYRAATRDEVIRLAAAGLLRSLPAITESKAGRILAAWRRDLPARAGLAQHA